MRFKKSGSTKWLIPKRTCIVTAFIALSCVSLPLLIKFIFRNHLFVVFWVFFLGFFALSDFGAVGYSVPSFLTTRVRCVNALLLVQCSIGQQDLIWDDRGSGKTSKETNTHNDDNIHCFCTII